MRSSTRATSLGEDAHQNEFGFSSSLRRTKVPLSTRAWLRESISSGDPVTQRTESAGTARRPRRPRPPEPRAWWGRHGDRSSLSRNARPRSACGSSVAPGRLELGAASEVPTVRAGGSDASTVRGAPSAATAGLGPGSPWGRCAERHTVAGWWGWAGRCADVAPFSGMPVRGAWLRSRPVCRPSDFRGPAGTR